MVRYAVRYAAGIGVLLLAGLTPLPAFGLAADYGKDDLKLHGTFAGQVPVHGYWVNWTDLFFYAGDARAFNQFVEAYSRLEHRRRKVVLHRGTKRAASPWDKGPRDIPADWSFYVWNTGRPLTGGSWPGEPPGPPAPTQIDVWVGARLKLSDLRIPAGMEVAAGPDAAGDGDIARFVAERAASSKPGQGKAPAAPSPEPLRLTVELSDGSRLRGEAERVKDLSLHTDLGKVAVALAKVKAMEFAGEQGPATVRFRNGDRLSGVFDPADWDGLKLRTLLGEIHVPARLIRSCTIEPAPRRAKVTARASSSWQTETPDRAFDGKGDSDWNAGDYAPAWIEADLGTATPLAELLLIPCQDIPGPTTHEVWISDAPIGDDRKKAKLVHTFRGPTHNRQPLRFDFPSGLSARYVQIRTTQSPTWVAWCQVEIRVR